LVDYDPIVGVFKSKVSKRVVGAKSSIGYIYIRINNIPTLAHRLAFLLMTGEIPAFVDHINGVRDDNRWGNLRAASVHINQQNLQRAQKNSKSGLLGVMYHKSHTPPWSARIYYDGKPHHLGYFKQPEDAHLRYLEEKRRVHPGCTI
jgi:hypothetical protein